jgi:hypothetical protein
MVGHVYPRADSPFLHVHRYSVVDDLGPSAVSSSIRMHLSSWHVLSWQGYVNLTTCQCLKRHLVDIVARRSSNMAATISRQGIFILSRYSCDKQAGEPAVPAEQRMHHLCCKRQIDWPLPGGERERYVNQRSRFEWYRHSHSYTIVADVFSSDFIPWPEPGKAQDRTDTNDTSLGPTLIVWQ